MTVPPLKGLVRVRITLSLPDPRIAIDRQSGVVLPMANRESFNAADRAPRRSNARA